MNLTLQDRYTILNLLPPAGELLYMRTVRELTDLLPATDEESEKYGLKVAVGEDGKPAITWNNNKDTVTDMTFSKRQRECIETQLKGVQGKITLQILPIWDAFFPEEEE